MTAALDALRSRFRTRCADDRERLLASVSARDTTAVRLLAHRLAGAAGTFGYPDLSALALELEDQAQDGETIDVDLLDAVATRLAAISRETST